MKGSHRCRKSHAGRASDRVAIVSEPAPVSRRGMLPGGVAFLASAAAPAAPAARVGIASRHSKWDTIEAAVEPAAKIGLDWMERSARPSGHITPKTVSRDLPRRGGAHPFLRPHRPDSLGQHSRRGPGGGSDRCCGARGRHHSLSRCGRLPLDGRERSPHTAPPRQAARCRRGGNESRSHSRAADPAGTTRHWPLTAIFVRAALRTSCGSMVRVAGHRQARRSQKAWSIFARRSPRC